MRLPAPCICRTLLALSCLSWIMADPDGVNLLEWDDENIQCIATLRPKEPCRQGQHGSTCPYLLSLPPLRVHLPRQLKELEKIMQDLEQLKDSVDELREMCADCRSGEEECRKQRIRGYENLNEGEEDIRWIIQTPAINMDDQESRPTDKGKVGNPEGDGDTQRQTDWKVKEMHLTKETEHYEKTQKEGSKEDDKLRPTKQPPSGEVNAADGNNRERETKKCMQNVKEASKQDQRDATEKEMEKNMTSNSKSLTNTNKDGLNISQYEKKIPTLTKVSDRKNMSGDLDVHTDEELEMRKDIERGLNVKANNEKPKQTESIGHGKKERIGKNGKVEEGREVGMETKNLETESQKEHNDGDYSFSKGNEKIGFSFVSTPDPAVTIKADSSNTHKIINLASSFPSPLLTNLSVDVIPDVSRETITTYGPTQRSPLAAAGTSEPLNFDEDVPTKIIVGGPTQQITSVKAVQNTTARAKPEAGFQDHNNFNATTKASSESLDGTTLPRTRDRSRWMAKKNISSTTKTSIKPLPGRGLKQKSQSKPEADHKLKNPKNERRVNRPPFPDKKLKYDQMQKPSHHVPIVNQSKSTNVSKTVQKLKPREQTPADSVKIVLKGTPTPRIEGDHTPDQKKPPAKRIKTQIVPGSQVFDQRPQSTNATDLERNPPLSQMHKTPIPPNSKLGRKQFYPGIDRKQKPEILSKTGKVTQTHGTLERPQDQTPFQEIESPRRDMIPTSPKASRESATETTTKTSESPSLEFTSKEDLTLGEKKVPEQITSVSQRPEPDQKSPNYQETPSTNLSKKPEDPISLEDLILGERNKPDPGHTPANQMTKPKQRIPKPGKNPPIDSIKKPNQSSSSPSSFYPDLSLKTQVFTPDEQNATLQDPITEPAEVFVEVLPSIATSDKASVPERKNIPDNISARFNIESNANPKYVTEAVKNVTSHNFGFHQEIAQVEKTIHDKSNTSTDQNSELRQNIPNVQPHPITKPIKNTEYSLKSDHVAIDSMPTQENILPISEKSQHPHQSLPVLKPMDKSDGNHTFLPKSDKDSTLGESKPERATITPDLKTLTPPKKIVTESFKKSNRSLTLSKSDQELPSREKSTHTLAKTPPDQRVDNSQKIPMLDHKPILEQRGKVDERPTNKKDTKSEEKPTPDEESPPQTSVSEPKPKVDGYITKKILYGKHSMPENRMTKDLINTPPDQESPPNQRFLNSNQTFTSESEANLSVETTSNQSLTNERKPDDKQSEQKLEIGSNINPKLKPNQLIKAHPKLVTDMRRKPTVGRKTDHPPQSNQRPEPPRIHPDPNPLPDEIPQREPGKTTKQKLPLHLIPPTSKPTFNAGTPSVPRPKPQVHDSSRKSKTNTDLPLISWTTTDNIPNAQSNVPPLSGSGTLISEVTQYPKEEESVKIIQKQEDNPKTSDRLEYRPFPQLNPPSDDFPKSMNRRVMSDLKPVTLSQPSQSPTTPGPNNGIPPAIIPSLIPKSITSNMMIKPNSKIPTRTIPQVKEDVSTLKGPSPSLPSTSTLRSDFRSTTPATSGLQLPAVQTTTPSARELRVKINQVAAFPHNSPKGRPPVRHPKQPPEDIPGDSRPDKTERTPLTPPRVSSVMRDCSDHRLMGHTKSGLYLVTPDLRSSSFRVFCDMELEGGGWTVLQLRQDGRVSFNRTWAEYRAGFGAMDKKGEFWLGNDMIHRLTRDRDMKLRVELEDFEGVAEFAQYEPFRVASERLRFRLTVGEYSGTAGDALHFNQRYEHNNRAFSTPDRDHDRYPSGNCGAYYSSGWWFDACMAANLNGRYYEGSYKGVRDGIYWGTWHSISTESYPTNDRLSFKRVRMLIRPRDIAP